MYIYSVTAASKLLRDRAYDLRKIYIGFSGRVQLEIHEMKI